MHPVSPVYDDVPESAPDFNLTWEYFGDWRQVRNTGNKNLVGGCREVIVSQRVRQMLEQLDVRRLVWVPITISKKGRLPVTGWSRTGLPNRGMQGSGERTRHE